MDAHHPASDKKRRRLREQGDVAPVADLVPVGLLGAAVVVWFWVGPHLLRGLAQLFQVLLSHPSGEGLQLASRVLLGLSLWTLVGMLCLALGASLPAWSASRWLWAPGRLGGSLFGGPHFSRQRGGQEVLIAFLALVGMVLLQARGSSLATWMSPGQAGVQAAAWLRRAFFLGAGVVLLWGMGSFFLERWRYEERIRMTDAEKRREVQEDQGSPEARRARDQVVGEILGQAGPSSSAGSAGLTVLEKPGGGR
jgi:flagellar biosynthesis protein FlhB